MMASDCDTLRQEDHTQCVHTYTHTHKPSNSLKPTGVCASREALYCISAGAAATERAKEDLGYRTSWCIQPCYEVRPFGRSLTAGHGRPEHKHSQSMKTIHQTSPPGRKTHQSHSLRQTQIIEDTERNYIFLVEHEVSLQLPQAKCFCFFLGFFF